MDPVICPLLFKPVTKPFGACEPPGSGIGAAVYVGVALLTDTKNKVDIKNNEMRKRIAEF